MIDSHQSAPVRTSHACESIHAAHKTSITMARGLSIAKEFSHLSSQVLSRTCFHLCTFKLLYIAGGFDGDKFKIQYGLHQAAVHPNPNHSTLAMQRKRTQDWLHVKNTEDTSQITQHRHLSHRTLHHYQQKTIIIQYNSNELQYLHLQAVVAALENDPDLSALQLPQILQTTYMATGCNYT